jgi:serine/threonine-protein phosphatase 2B regulatory subunit
MPPKNKGGSREIKPVTRQITDEEYRAIEQATGFPKENTNALFQIYAPYETKTLGAEGKEVLRADFDDLKDHTSICVHPLIELVLELHNLDRSGKISFVEFVTAMRALSVRSTLDEKLRFTFDLFDMDGTGQLQSPEMFQLLRMMLGRAIDDHDLQEITDTYLKRFPTGCTFDIFCQMFDVSDLNKLTLNL